MTDNMAQLIQCRRAYKHRHPKGDSIEESGSSDQGLKLLQDDDGSPVHRSKRHKRLALVDLDCSPTSAQEILLSDSDDDEVEIYDEPASNSDVEMISCTAAPCATANRSQPSTFTEPLEGRPEVHQEPSQSPQRVVKKYMDWALGVYVRLHDSGAVSPAEKFVSGPNGFKMAVWSDGDQVESELSNIDAPELPIVMKKPAAARKKVKNAAPAPADSVDEEEEETPEEEDAEAQVEAVQEVHAISDSESAGEPVEAVEDAEEEAAAEQLQSFSGFVHPLLGALAGGCYAKQSYIVAKSPTDGVKRLVVAASCIQSAQHPNVCNRLFRWVMAHPQANKEVVMLKRAEFLMDA